MLFRIFTVLAVAALVLSTWILSKPGRIPKPQSGSEQARRPGYYLNDAVLTDYDRNGNVSVRIAAQRIDQLDQSNAVALHNIRVNYQAPGGQSWVLVGDLAHVEPGGTVVDVSGHVRLQGVQADRTAAAAVILTDQMTYNVADGIASTASDVRIDFADQHLTARGMIANLRERTLRLESQVNGRFHP